MTTLTSFFVRASPSWPAKCIPRRPSGRWTSTSTPTGSELNPASPGKTPDQPQSGQYVLRELVTSTTVICNTRTRVEGRSELQLDPPFPGNPPNPGNPDENSQMLILMHRHRGSVDLGRKRWSIFDHGSSESRFFIKTW